MKQVNQISKDIMFEFFETIYDKSDLFKLRTKVNKIKLELDTNKKLTDKSIEKKLFELSDFEILLIEQRKKSASGEIREWINAVVSNAISLNANAKDTAISVATHVAKLTHSSINWATSILYENNNENYYLSTSSIQKLKVDVAHPDLKLAPISKFLLFLYDKNHIAKVVKAEDFNIFKPFSVDNKEFTEWKYGFFLYCTQNPIATHYLAKQVYFPVNDQYHLLNPMIASSLEQEVYERLNFDKEVNEIRGYKNKGVYNPSILTSYPNKAILKVTASNNSNASLSNGKRGGKRYLLPSMPPTWQKMESPPLKQKTIFSGEFEKRARESTKELQKYLIKLQDIKFGNKSIRDQIKQHINNIINTLFDYVLEVQAMPSGWSEKSKLEEKSHAHALWLDSNRDDKAFQEKRKNGQWQEIVCQDFGLWMNSQLSNKDMKLVKFEKNKWAKLLKNRLNLFDKGWGASK